LKQLAEAENDDFQEIITLVGMISKPLHVKRFKKALADYQHHRLSTEETLSDRHLFPSLIHPISTNNSPKFINSISSNWCLNVRENRRIFVNKYHLFRK
jgi:response regulator of citrate/malate metabolism